MISLVKNLKCISRQNIHYYRNRRYKSYITSLKDVIVSKGLVSAALDIDRILHFVFYDKTLQIYRQHWVRKFYQYILSKYRQISNKWEGCYTPIPPPPPPPRSTRLWSYPGLFYAVSCLHYMTQFLLLVWSPWMLESYFRLSRACKIQNFSRVPESLN